MPYVSGLKISMQFHDVPSSKLGAKADRVPIKSIHGVLDETQSYPITNGFQSFSGTNTVDVF